MLDRISPLEALRGALASGAMSAAVVAAECRSRVNGSASKNTYLTLPEMAFPANGPLLGVPISVKDCFDMAGTVTTCGSRFYANHTAIAEKDSAMVAAVRRAGATITGKTHLHPLAYGITGQNPEFGDCLQPRDAALLTGGSSSGAAASVQEGSALAGIGTDTGGSIRVPAALCGLAGYRASHALAAQHTPSLWEGGVHLAPSFDTPGFLVRDPRDLAPIATALFGIGAGVAPRVAPPSPRVGFVEEAFFPDANLEVRLGYAEALRFIAPTGSFRPEWWHDSREIFAGIQATEAAAIHEGHFAEFEAAIAQRLAWGASIASGELGLLRERLQVFRTKMARLLSEFEFLVMPCAPVNRLVAAEDQSEARAAILRYTTPFSLAGLPVVSLPCELLGGPFGTGIQVAAAAGEDAALLAFAARLGERIAGGC